MISKNIIIYDHQNYKILSYTIIHFYQHQFIFQDISSNIDYDNNTMMENINDFLKCISNIVLIMTLMNIR